MIPDRILLVFPLEFEADALRRHSRELQRIAATTNHPERLVFLEVCGMGRAKFESCLRQTILRRNPNLVLLAGFCGALRPDLPIGTLIEFNSDKNTTKKINPFIYSEMPCYSRLNKLPLQRTFPDAEAVDMESEPFLRVCAEFQIPCRIVRSVSDRLGDEIPLSIDTLLDSECNRPRIAAILTHLIFHPHKIPAFVQFVVHAHHARRSLTARLLQILRDPETASCGATAAFQRARRPSSF